MMNLHESNVSIKDKHVLFDTKKPELENSNKLYIANLFIIYVK